MDGKFMTKTDFLEIEKKQICDYIGIGNKILEDTSLLKKISKAAEICIEAYSKGGKTIFAGNGGSAADAQHMAGEFVSKFYFDRPGLSSIALTTDTSILTAIGNDYGYEKLFERQLQALGCKNDVFFGFSTSGNSVNLVNALTMCKTKGIYAIALTGEAPCKMDDYDLVIKVPSKETPRIQECHTLIGHMICCIVEEHIFGNR